MENLRSILTKIEDTMVELEAILAEEMNQLRRPQINPVSLQIVADTKSRLLSTISYYDELRRQEELRLNLEAPYYQNAAFSRSWKNITERVTSANQYNQNIYSLLDIHMQKINNLKTIVNKAENGTALYSQDGQSRAGRSGKVYNFSI
ncbi:hypothetical protein C3432_25985 [Citrobacter amalonaticus]|uniref:Flagellar biosynthesis protein FlgN n=1 Tax=Citrobacter amalonaticus TaxID=35703 RepID=A0A2S4RR87_CITAM|nr:flagellar export chaperone FlgN [Citrobacter amalonaticus]POT54740.1 hypothetical protein C3432_25985 [Citrobacter amalonaticus]POT69948.1 hypothetical protein C3436_25780 [Citrobacter amalonaticus]POU61207.1 hypothetical protein C3430_24695 [Citrobacter amalonaticus]POV02561.1 hypothetical protein C3424_26025 [Citrobacter amalonaticus]